VPFEYAEKDPFMTKHYVGKTWIGYREDRYGVRAHLYVIHKIQGVNATYSEWTMKPLGPEHRAGCKNSAKNFAKLRHKAVSLAVAFDIPLYISEPIKKAPVGA
jgi:hypothetical protein